MCAKPMVWSWLNNVSSAWLCSREQPLPKSYEGAVFLLARHCSDALRASLFECATRSTPIDCALARDGVGGAAEAKESCRFKGSAEAARGLERRSAEALAVDDSGRESDELMLGASLQEEACEGVREAPALCKRDALARCSDAVLGRDGGAEGAGAGAEVARVCAMTPAPSIPILRARAAASGSKQSKTGEASKKPLRSAESARDACIGSWWFTCARWSPLHRVPYGSSKS